MYDSMYINVCYKIHVWGHMICAVNVCYSVQVRVLRFCTPTILKSFITVLCLLKVILYV